MAQGDALKRYLAAGMSFTATTKKRAEQIAKDLMRAGEIQRNQVQSQVEEIIDRGRRNSEHLVALIRKEVTSQLGDLTTSLRDELRALERRINTVTTRPAATEQPAPAEPASVGDGEPAIGGLRASTAPIPAQRKVQAKKAPAKRATPAGAPATTGPTKSAPKKTAAPKTAVTKKTMAKKTVAKKTVAKKTVAKKTVAKKAVAKAPTEKVPTKKAVAKKAPAGDSSLGQASSMGPGDTPADAP